MEEYENPLLNILKEAISNSSPYIFQDYLTDYGEVKKWSCYSDYQFDDKNKPNDVVTYTFVPYIHDFEDLSNLIKSLAKKDIKHSQTVQDSFIQLLKNYPFLNASFILENRKNLFFDKIDEHKIVLENSFEFIKGEYQKWRKEDDDKKLYYGKKVKQIEEILRLVKENKKIKQITDMMLVTFLGGYLSGEIAKKTNSEIFGWFSDRDAINEVADNYSIDLFHYYFYSVFQDKCNFVASPAGSMANAFYEDLVRIPDYMVGSLADHDFINNTITKEKFNQILTNYMAENTYNNFVFKIKFDSTAGTSSTRLLFHKKEI